MDQFKQRLGEPRPAIRHRRPRRRPTLPQEGEIKILEVEGRRKL